MTAFFTLGEIILSVGEYNQLKGYNNEVRI